MNQDIITHKHCVQKKLIDFITLHNIKNLDTSFITLKMLGKQQRRRESFEKIQNFDIKIARNDNFIQNDNRINSTL